MFSRRRGMAVLPDFAPPYPGVAAQWHGISNAYTVADLCPPSWHHTPRPRARGQAWLGNEDGLADGLAALPQATWAHVDKTNKTQTQKRKMAGYRLGVEDDAVSRQRSEQRT